MLRYRDMTFCSCDCINDECFRMFTEKDKQVAGKQGVPVDFADHKDGCKWYVAPKDNG